MQIVIATNNKDKLREISQILGIEGVEFLGLDAFPECPEAEETGQTYADNALIKAQTAAYHAGTWALADDSGLEVDALGGQPGIFSSRYAGLGASYAGNVRKLLESLKNVPDEKRTARFVCSIALVSNNNRAYFTEGRVEGRIISEPRGENGFGYDPVFLLPELDKTMAQLAPVEKNKISHRTMALNKIAPLIRSLAAGEKAVC
jgi:XTP/dITP diphosphohydrolase